MEFLNSLFFPMLAGHMAADFWAQPASWVVHKKEYGWKSSRMVIHAAIAACIPVLFTFRTGFWWFVPILFITHYALDVLKSKFRDTIFAFLADQLLHIAVLAGLAWITGPLLNETMTKFWIYGAGFILVTHPSGIFTGMFLKSVTKTEITQTKLDASAWIGILERILIVVFVTMSQFQAIGFLVAAKSIFRFNDTKEEGTLKAEYFLLGTMVSFFIAIVIGLAIRWLTVSPQPQP
jgi:hypothetical protein